MTRRRRRRRDEPLSWRRRIARVCWTLALVLLTIATCGVL